MTLILTWKHEPLDGAHFKERRVLYAPGFSSPTRTDGAIGGCYYEGNRRWVASAVPAWEHQFHIRAGSRHAAMSRLERELDRRSIGVFGEDDIVFVGAR